MGKVRGYEKESEGGDDEDVWALGFGFVEC